MMNNTKIKRSRSRSLFMLVNYLIIITAALLCVVPLIHVLAISFSSNYAAASGQVKLLPVEFTLQSYEFVFRKMEFWKSMLISLIRLSLAIPVNMILTILVAYPLSKSEKTFRTKKFYAWFFILTILFNGGLIPTYMVISKLGLIDTIWSLVLPGAVPVFNVIVLLNFFKQIPDEIEEAAFIDGANYFQSLVKIYLPLSKPAIATLLLFVSVAHWNAWFDGIIFMNRPEHYPLQSYLRTVVVNQGMAMMNNIDEARMFADVSERTFKSAQIFLAAVPILVLYPFLQKYFTTGIVLGSVKG